MSSNHPRSCRRRAVVVLTTSLAFLFLTRPAGAHVEPTTATGEAGRRADVGFVPTHGCGDSPTIGIDIKLPDGVLDPIAAELDGWTASVDRDVVTWDGGPLPDGDEATFSVNVLLPDVPGTTLSFPTIQRCPNDTLSWIQQPDDGTDQSFPAPALAIVEATGPPGTTSPPPPTAAPTTAVTEATSPSTTSPTTAVPVSTTVPQATLVESGSGGSSFVPILIALGGVIVVGAGAILFFRRRSAS